jgi:hypothetical protein
MTVSDSPDVRQEIAALSDEELKAAFVTALFDTRVPGWYDRVMAEDRMHALLSEAERRKLKLLEPASA